MERFRVVSNELTDGSVVYEVEVIDEYGQPHLFWSAPDQWQAEEKALALNNKMTMVF